MPIPNDAVAENFEKLDQVIDSFNPAELIFLGDLFHSSSITNLINSNYGLKTKVYLYV
jgi:metallophosphoesterase superfamily enzyme